MNATLMDGISFEDQIEFDSQTYKKKLLKRTSNYEVFLICWKSGQQTSIHDHPDGGCWMRVVRGSLQETTYMTPNLEEVGERILGPGDLGFQCGSDMVHRILALEDTVSLHVYYPPGYAARKYSFLDGVAFAE
jgi:predicted metal-dependent enzyme (double-stranded beta helix superfamily)